MSTVSIFVISAASGHSHDTLMRWVRAGKMPKPDSRSRKGNGWRLSTIRFWNPALAAKIERGLKLKVFSALAA